MKQIAIIILFMLFPGMLFPPLTSGEMKSKEPMEEAGSLNQKMTELYKAGKYEEAIPYAKKVLEIKKKELGEEHPEVAESMNDLGVLYHASGKHKEAELLLNKALEIREKTLCEWHPDLVESMENLAEFYSDTGRRDQANSLLRKVSEAPGKKRMRNPIGLLLEGYEGNCEARRKCESDLIGCEYRMELFEGDEIIKFPDTKTIKIQWLSPPYTSAEQLSKTRLKMAFNPPQDKTGILATIKDALPFFAKTPHRESYGVVRGIVEVFPQPGYIATVLPGYPVTFAWGKKGGKGIIFKDSKGRLAFQKEIKGQDVIVFTPEEIGLRPSEVYTWDIDGITLDEQYRVSLLKNEVAHQIINDLKNIDEQNIVSNDKKIQKSVYLQLMSDTYLGEIDLYWLSYQVLKTSSDSDIVKKLKDRYLEHLANTSSSKSK